MNNESHTSGIIHAKVRKENGGLVPETPIDELRTRIDDGHEIFIFDAVYSADECVALRRAMLDWGRANAVWPAGISASKPGINFHRVDDGSVATSMAHIFHQFGFSDPGTLPPALSDPLLPLRAELLDLQNRLAGTAFEPGGDEFRLKAMRHPRGGGHLVPHTHPYLPTRVALFLNLSQPGSDYRSGAARFHTKKHGWIDTHDDFRIGDILAWRYDLVHDIAPVESGSEPVWDGDDGLWICAMEATESHLHSEPTQ